LESTDQGYNGGNSFRFENCVFYGDLRVRGYLISYTSCTFYRRVILDKMNGTDPRLADWTSEWTPPQPLPAPTPVAADGIRVNTFYGPVIIKGVSNIISGWNNTTIRSVFNEDVTLINSSTGWFFDISANTTADVFNKKLTLGGSVSNMRFGINGAVTKLAEGVSLLDGGTYGTLNLARVELKGAMSRQLIFSGAGLRFVSGFVSESPLTISAPQLYFDGGRFLKPATFTKTANGDNVSLGSNVFKDKVVIINQATSGLVRFATQAPDVIDKSTDR